MPRRPAYSTLTYSIGPGPVSRAVKYLIIANLAVFLLWFSEPLYAVIVEHLGLTPADVIQRLSVWQLVTYMFLHGGIGHILFNMLGLWMFGTDLERMWGTRFFVKYYFVTGIGAGLTVLAYSLLPLNAAAHMFNDRTIGASGAIFGLLVAYALYFPERRIILVIFPIPAKYFVMIFGAISFVNALNPGRGVSDTAHVGGLLVGYLYLRGLRKGFRLHPWAEVKYRYLKWRINRARRKFDVYSGGRTDDWNRRIH